MHKCGIVAVKVNSPFTIFAKGLGKQSSGNGHARTQEPTGDPYPPADSFVLRTW
jgi:hypothetical protein